MKVSSMSCLTFRICVSNKATCLSFRIYPCENSHLSGLFWLACSPWPFSYSWLTALMCLFPFLWWWNTFSDVKLLLHAGQNSGSLTGLLLSSFLSPSIRPMTVSQPNRDLASHSSSNISSVSYLTSATFFSGLALS